MEPKQIHEALEPLKFIIGKWKSISADGKFLPRVEPFTYCEELEFTSIGQPMLNYKSTSWHPTAKHPMHLESGFLKIKPGTKDVAFLVSHNFGLTTIEEGNVCGNSIKVKSVQINRCSFNKDPAVTQLERCLTLQDNGNLEVITHMATTLNPTLTEHLTVTYEKIE